MNLPQEAIKEFQDIWQQEYGETITTEEAQFEGLNLLQLFKVITKK